IRAAVFAIFFGIPAALILTIQFRAIPERGPACVWVIGFLFAVVALVQARRCVVLLVWPDQHWIGKCLRQIDPQPWDLARSIAAEWRADGGVGEGVAARGVSWARPDVWFTVLTENWLVHVSPGRIVILMPDQICWVYRK